MFFSTESNLKFIHLKVGLLIDVPPSRRCESFKVVYAEQEIFLQSAEGWRPAKLDNNLVIHRERPKLYPHDKLAALIYLF